MHEPEVQDNLPKYSLFRDDAWHSFEVVEKLLDQGADPNERNSYGGHTVLHSIGFEPHVTDDMYKVAKLLIARGANVLQKNELGEIPSTVAKRQVNPPRSPDSEYIELLRVEEYKIYMKRS